ncbi:YfiR/HmsC family protein [Bowmanella sp. JS7-9]|uniref:histidine kinase n=1 Tax=Pseudobowmanella zhangzhouensis TaxID=1537679 RepID=A0ABW1XRS1_9ALTE|nr:YfiR/HmsC family protein [Bowmanella sp. JS7-9]
MGRRLVLVMMAGLIVLSGMLHAQSQVSEAQLKAAFIARFKESIQWPENRATLNALYWGNDDEYWQSLQQMSQRPTGKKSITLRRINRLSDIQSADILILAANQSRELEAVNGIIARHATLVISEGENNQNLIGINFRVKDEGTLSFELNRYNLVYQGLSLDENFVLLGGSEIDIASMVRDMSVRLSESTGLITKLNSQITQLNQSLEDKQRQLTHKTDELATLSTNLQKAQSDYQRSIQQINDELASARTELQRESDRVEQKQREVSDSQQELSQLSQEQQKLNQQVIENIEKIRTQTLQLSELERNLHGTESLLESTVQTVQQRTQGLYISLVVLGLLLLMVLMMYRQYRTKQRLSELLVARNQELQQANKQLVATQTQLVEAEKMSALASLVTGVAHEVNTPLGSAITAISSCSDVIDELLSDFNANRLKRSEFVQKLSLTVESSHIALNNLMRAAELIRSFKQVSVDQVAEDAREFNLDSYVEGVTTSLYHECKRRGVTIERHCDPSLSIYNYPGVLSQILTNLIMNSMVHGFKETESPRITMTFSEQQNDIMLRYQDNGCGITEAVRPKIFDPFFTTNRANGGSGLGLHICYNLVTQKMGGAVSCLPSEGGALFELHFAKDIRSH